MTAPTFSEILADAEAGEIVAEYRWTVRGQVITWRVMRYWDGAAFALASDTSEPGEFSVFITGLTEKAATRRAEKAARRYDGARTR